MTSYFTTILWLICYHRFRDIYIGNVHDLDLQTGTRPNMHDSDLQTGTRPNVHDPDLRNGTRPNVHDPDRRNGTRPNVHDSDLQNGTRPNVHDSDLQNGTRPKVHDPDLRNGTRPNVNMPIEMPHINFYLFALITFLPPVIVCENFTYVKMYLIGDILEISNLVIKNNFCISVSINN